MILTLAFQPSGSFPWSLQRVLPHPGYSLRHQSRRLWLATALDSTAPQGLRASGGDARDGAALCRAVVARPGRCDACQSAPKVARRSCRRDIACVHEHVCLHIILHPSCAGPLCCCRNSRRSILRSDNCNRQAAGGLERYDMRVRSCVKGLVRRTFEYLTEGVGAPSSKVSTASCLCEGLRSLRSTR